MTRIARMKVITETPKVTELVVVEVEVELEPEEAE